MFLVQRVQNVVKNRRVSCQKNLQVQTVSIKYVCLGLAMCVAVSRRTGMPGENEGCSSPEWLDMGMLDTTLNQHAKTQGRDDPNSATVSNNKTAASLCTLYKQGLSLDFQAVSPWNFCPGPGTDILIWFIDDFFVWNSRRQDSCFIQT